MTTVIGIEFALAFPCDSVRPTIACSEILQEVTCWQNLLACELFTGVTAGLFFYYDHQSLLLCPLHRSKDHLLCRGEACITITRADVATSEEARFATLTSASRASPLTAIMHAGAVLDSAVISNISLSGLRTEFRWACRCRAVAMLVLQLSPLGIQTHCCATCVHTLASLQC